MFRHLVLHNFDLLNSKIYFLILRECPPWGKSHVIFWTPWEIIVWRLVARCNCYTRTLLSLTKLDYTFPVLLPDFYGISFCQLFRRVCRYQRGNHNQYIEDELDIFFKLNCFTGAIHPSIQYDFYLTNKEIIHKILYNGM
jgi:hypothetical protein